MTKLIYVESEIRDHPRVLSICQKYPTATIVECDHYGQLFNRNNQSFRVQKANPALILAKKKNKRVLPVPPGLEIKQASYYFSHMLNCVYDCRYCFLQGMFKSANYVIFVNYEDFYEEIIKISEKNAGEAFFFSGYDCDSMALEPITNFAKHFLPIFREIGSSTLELRTKSTQIRTLLETEAIPNVICSYSLNPEEIITQFEHKTPSLNSRIESIQKLSTAGWKIGLRFDPIVLTKDFKQLYADAFNQIFSSIEIELIESITLGAFRLSSQQHKRMLRDLPREWLYHTVSSDSANRVGYNFETEKHAIDWCKEQLKIYTKNKPIIVHRQQ